MRILDRYHTAVHATSLKSEPTTTWSDTDVLGAAGLAARVEPLGIELARMLAGGGAGGVISILAKEAYVRSHIISKRVTVTQAENIAKAVLAWYRHGTCQPCGGTGFKRIKDTPSLGDECSHCEGTGRIPFEKQFQHEHREIARYLHDEIGTAQSKAGRMAMLKIAPLLNL